MTNNPLKWFNLYWRFFGESILAGQIWQFTANDNKGPWPSEKEEPIVTIIDCKGGWVRYKWNGTPMYQDERMKEWIFRDLWKNITEYQQPEKYHLRQVK